MSSRTTGLILMTISIAAFVGTTSNTLPAITFFPALVLFGTGAIKFLRANHSVLEQAEKDVRRKLNPVVNENRQTQAHALRQAGRQGEALSHSGAFETTTAVAPREMIEFEDDDEHFEVATDVSFPVEVQVGDALADQLRKLNQLLEQGVLTAEEYAVAKAKILS